MTQTEFGRIFTSVLDMGEIMLTSGAEVNRVEDTLQRMLKAYGCQRVDVFTITSSIVVTVRTSENEALTQTRRITNYETDMHKLDLCNALSRRVCLKTASPQELEEEVENIRAQINYPARIRFLTYGMISGSFSIFFGGNVMDGLASVLCGFILFFSIELCGRLKLQRIIQTIICSAMVGLGAVFFTGIGLGTSVDKIIIGNIMLLIPGIAFTTSVRDMISGDTISGLLGLCEAVIRALAIAVGFALVLWGLPV